MTLPASRNRTYGTDTPVNPGDLNDIQDCIIGRKHGPITRQIAVRPTVPGAFVPAIQMFESDASGVTMFAPLDFLGVGDRLLQLDARVRGNGVVDCLINLKPYIDETVGTSLASINDLNRAAAYGTLNLFTGARLIAPDEIIWLEMTPNAAAYRISRLIATWDHP